MRKLVAFGPLGDRCPSQLFRDMQLLDPNNHAGTGMKKAIFINLMPVVSSVLLRVWSLQRFLLLLIVSLTRKIRQILPFLPVSQVSPETPEASGEVLAMQKQTKQKSANFCWYHRRWGPKAQKCTPPCSWSSEMLTRVPSGD